MEEEAQAVLRTALAQFLPQREQVIILNPDRVVFFDQRLDGVGEAFVDALVPAGEFAFIFRQIDAIVKERPQGAVRIAVIIFLDILLFEVDGRGGDAFAALEGDLAGIFVGALARPTEPHALILAKRRGEGDGEAALCAPGFGPRGGGHTIGNDDQTAQRIELQGLDSRTAQLIMPTSE